MLSDEIKITVLEIKGRQVRLGIEAPPHIPVHREEVYQRIEAERVGEGDVAQGDGDEFSQAKEEVLED